MPILELLGCFLETSLVQSLVVAPGCGPLIIHGSWGTRDRAEDQRHLEKQSTSVLA